MRPSTVKINLEALYSNLRLVKSKTKNTPIVAMVKANAYGHGLKRVALALEGQVDAFGVACLEEAKTLIAIGIQTPVLLAEGCFTLDEYDYIEHHNIAVVVHSPYQLKQILNREFKNPIEIWLKLDSGMNRLGFGEEEWQQAYLTLKQCRWVKQPITLMSHFCSADELDNQTTAHQIARVNKVATSLNIPISLANSAAILRTDETHFDWVRPGLMLYGISPFSQLTEQEIGLKPVMQFESCLFNIKLCLKGQTIGYNQTWQAKRLTKVGFVAIGYGDGYPWHINTNAYVLVDGYQAPIIGRVSMDMITIDITDVPTAQLGSHVELWGNRLSVQTVAKFANTIPYELLCHAPLQRRTF
jgi:alanine racemase